ncbi:hypothetical protein EAG_12412 [Camponotus floridanus]|uniref:Uncharacterized protein n=1 Tax=Camponotus floridanus TaxID=104421 RepID=E2AWE9_CAMFO|nr:hypothetical protein EAG_12412 [Camponotus floridanus]
MKYVPLALHQFLRMAVHFKHSSVTARFTTLSFNRPVTGGFNLRSRSAGSLDSISLQADTLLDVLHEHTTVHLYGSGTCTHRRAVCTNSMSPLEFRQHVDTRKVHYLGTDDELHPRRELRPLINRKEDRKEYSLALDARILLKSMSNKYIDALCEIFETKSEITFARPYSRSKAFKIEHQLFDNFDNLKRKFQLLNTEDDIQIIKVQFCIPATGSATNKIDRRGYGTVNFNCAPPSTTDGRFATAAAMISIRKVIVNALVCARKLVGKNRGVVWHGANYPHPLSFLRELPTGIQHI